MQVCIDNPWILKGWVLWLREDIGINFYYLGRHSKNSNRYFHLTKAELLLLKLLQLFARDVLAMKKLEIEKTKPTFIISTFKTEIIKVGLFFSISSFLIA